MNTFFNTFILSRSAHTFYASYNGKNSTYVRKPALDNGIPEKKNDTKRVLEILSEKFNMYRNGITTDLPSESVGNVVKRTLRIDTFLDFIHLSENPAIITPNHAGDLTTHMTHNQIYTFIKNSFNLAQFNLGRGDRVAICLPEGPLLNLCLISTIAYCICVPSNSKLTSNELVNDYKKLKVKAVIVPFEKLITSGDDALMIAFRHAGFQLIGLKTISDTNINFTLVSDPANVEHYNKTITDSPPLNEANNVVLILQTSGTTGQKKIVPYRLQTLCISTICVIFSLDIKHNDTIINMMPLFHVGGIVRNVLATLFSGGSIIQCQVNSQDMNISNL